MASELAWEWDLQASCIQVDPIKINMQKARLFVAMISCREVVVLLTCHRPWQRGCRAPSCAKENHAEMGPVLSTDHLAVCFEGKI